MSHSDTRRLFVALWPPPPVVADLDTDLRHIRRTAPPSLRWQPPDRWHVTVLFLGESSARRARTVVARAAAGIPPGEVTGGGAGHFGRVLWWGIEAPWAAGLHATVCHLAGRPRDPRWRPHLTLARSRGAPIPPQVLHDLRDLPSRTWQADRLRLVASTIGPEPRYDTLLETPLTG